MSATIITVLIVCAWWLSGFLLIQACVYFESGAPFGGDGEDYTIGMLLYEIMGGFLGLLFIISLADILYTKYWTSEGGGGEQVAKIMDFPLKDLFISKDEK